MSTRRPLLPHSMDNTMEARCSPCPPVPWQLALFSRVVAHHVDAEVRHAMKVMQPTVKAGALWGVAWTATTVLAWLRIWQALTEQDDQIGD